ncbi:hypothetical protein DP116_01385 [Brasilonema bromeliae SPC951]|uniref:Uncharacterized protein n=1 Tax=Brasilonema bromeliae SPC951 TaxID=385972 RepID=A0ABX1P365_9CYAN|nr:hypothetical protein [Brasilonema bromeliae SPC951]
MWENSLKNNSETPLATTGGTPTPDASVGKPSSSTGSATQWLLRTQNSESISGDHQFPTNKRPRLRFNFGVLDLTNSTSHTAVQNSLLILPTSSIDILLLAQRVRRIYSDNCVLCSFLLKIHSKLSDQ